MAEHQKKIELFSDGEEIFVQEEGTGEYSLSDLVIGIVGQNNATQNQAIVDTTKATIDDYIRSDEGASAIKKHVHAFFRTKRGRSIVEKSLQTFWTSDEGQLFLVDKLHRIPAPPTGTEMNSMPESSSVQQPEASLDDLKLSSRDNKRPHSPAKIKRHGVSLATGRRSGRTNGAAVSSSPKKQKPHNGVENSTEVQQQMKLRPKANKDEKVLEYRENFSKRLKDFQNQRPAGYEPTSYDITDVFEATFKEIKRCARMKNKTLRAQCLNELRTWFLGEYKNILLPEQKKRIEALEEYTK